MGHITSVIANTRPQQQQQQQKQEVGIVYRAISKFRCQRHSQSYLHIYIHTYLLASCSFIGGVVVTAYFVLLLWFPKHRKTTKTLTNTFLMQADDLQQVEMPKQKQQQ